MRKVLLPLVVLAALTAACGGQSPPADDADASAGNTSETSESSTTAQPAGTVMAVTVKGGEVTNAPGAVKVKLGEPVVIKVTADASDEVHVHGYDLAKAVKPGEPLTIDFVADIPGQFEVELENAHVKLFEFQVVE